MPAGRGDGPARLGGDPGGDAGVGAGSRHDLAPLGDRRRRLALDVGDADAAADGQLGEVERHDERGERLHGLLEEPGDEHLRADVGVDADQLDGVGRAGPLDGPAGVTGGQAEPELRVVLAGHHVLVGVGLDARRHAQQHLRHDAVLAVQAFQAVELVERVDDDAPDAGPPSGAQLVVGLVVAVQHDALAGHVGGQRDRQLTRRRDVEVHALLVREPGHRPAQERLGRVGHAVPERGDRLPAARPQVRLVVDEERRAVLVGQRVQVAPPDQQLPVRPDLGRVRQQPPRQHAHRDDPRDLGHSDHAGRHARPKSPAGPAPRHLGHRTRLAG